MYLGTNELLQSNPWFYRLQPFFEALFSLQESGHCVETVSAVLRANRYFLPGQLYHLTIGVRIVSFCLNLSDQLTSLSGHFLESGSENLPGKLPAFDR